MKNRPAKHRLPFSWSQPAFGRVITDFEKRLLNSRLSGAVAGPTVFKGISITNFHIFSFSTPE